MNEFLANPIGVRVGMSPPEEGGEAVACLDLVSRA